jgi:ubiquinone/menaquinone biosynthesis C-methylase UbiE
MMKPQDSLDFRRTLRRMYVDDFLTTHASSLRPASLVLDLGGTKTHKRGLFDISRFDINVLTYNLVPTKGVDVQGTALALALESGCVDAVICSEVLEHITEPVMVLAEIYRILRPGGVMFATVPFLYRIHADPSDYGRYTHHFWSAALSAIGFTGVQVTAQGYFFTVLEDFILQYHLEKFSRPPFRRASRFLATIIIRQLLQAEQKDKYSNHPFIQSFTTGYGFVAAKPE